MSQNGRKYHIFYISKRYAATHSLLRQITSLLIDDNKKAFYRYDASDDLHVNDLQRINKTAKDNHD